MNEWTLEDDYNALGVETKGGKPSTGTPKDGRLKENGGGSGGSKPSSDEPKKPFPGAAKPFPKKP